VKKIKDFLRRNFITGLLVIIPIWATYYVLAGLLSVIDGMLGDVPRYFLGHRFPGLGILTLVLFILTVGILSANYLGTRLVKLSDRILQRVPLVRGIYTTIKQILETFSIKQNFHGVALVEYPRKGCYSVGFMTSSVKGETIGLAGKYKTVFVPTTPNPTAGFLLILPEAEVAEIDMTVEQGMKFIVSLGLVPMDQIDANKLRHRHVKEPGT
jgi:uncharacterized membrane protein